ncbi:MAG: superoxide dismutase family protein [Clostridia bacterium]|nr:superoxide dismutase family protein [Clostridia bacterium]
MNRQNTYPNFGALLRHRPEALAIVDGDEAHPNIRGVVRFYGTRYGVLVVAEIEGLPTRGGACDSPIFALHIHEGDACRGTADDPFAAAKGHYNPHGCPHPYHAGDLPPLFGCNGYAFLCVLTDRFTVEEVLGRTVVIHASPDDFTTQPAGNAHGRIACGVIQG